MGLVCPGIETLAIPIYISTSKGGDSLFPWQQWSSLIRKVKMVSWCSFTLHLSYKWGWHLFMFQSHLISFTVTGQYLFLHFSSWPHFWWILLPLKKPNEVFSEREKHIARANRQVFFLHTSGWMSSFKEVCPLLKYHGSSVTSMLWWSLQWA